MYALRLHGSPQAGPGLAGQIEHVLSGKRLDFADAAQLLAALEQLQAHAWTPRPALRGPAGAAPPAALRPPAA
jgi:hypothetical protein